MKKTRIEREKRTVEFMIRLYCRKKEGHKELCSSCLQLLEYAKERLSKCNFGEKKSSCRSCPIHCYSPEMRSKIRQVMRFSGPRMLLSKPLDFLHHLISKPRT